MRHLNNLVLTGVLLAGFCCKAAAQGNSWTNAVSGNWEDFDWSLGILPGSNQDILLTNAGWKALEIGTNAALSFPQTLTVRSLTIASPTNSFNELLLNYAGLQSPLVIGGSNTEGSLVIESNAAFYMLGSTLVVNDPTHIGPSPGGAFSIGGSFVESDASEVTANSLHVGDIGPAAYDLTNSMLTVGDTEYVGGGYPATFNQQGGSNTTGALVLQAGGEYDLYDGNFDGSIELQGGNFNQWGGAVTTDLQYQFWLGNYHLAAGILSPGDLAIPGTPPLNLPQAASGLLLQTGGTNLAGSILLGNNYGPGTYDLSNGTLAATSLSVGYYEQPDGSISGCTFIQSGGFHTNGGIGLYGGYDRYLRINPSFYLLSGGTLITPSIDLNMSVINQTGGTNDAAEVTLSDVSSYTLNGGLLAAQSIQMHGGSLYNQTGAFTQSGGTNEVTDLSLANGSIYALTGGLLWAGNTEINDASIFHHTGGALNLAGVLTLGDGTWDEQTSGQQFGQLQLGAGTNSTIALSTNSCAIEFADSSSIAWASNAVLTIQNWNGSVAGGGQDRIVFGNSSSSLTVQQLSHIQFLNPSGMGAGTYPAAILASGEVVPMPPTPLLAISGSPSSGFQVTLHGQRGQNYEIDVSTDLVHWTPWTQASGGGPKSFADVPATNFTARYYRAIPGQ